MVDAAFQLAPVGLGAFDRQLRWTRINHALSVITRTSPEQLLGRRPSDILPGPLSEATEAMLRRVLERGVVERGVISGETADAPGVQREWDVTWYPLPDGVGVVVTEVTEQRRAERELEAIHRRDALLARAGQLLSTALSVQETANLVAQLVVPEIADWCFVELVQESGAIDRVAMAHRDPEKMTWIRMISERYPLDPDSPVGSPKVIRTGEPELTPEIPDGVLELAAQDADHLEALRQIGFVSACIVPLMARGRVLGDIALATAESGRRFGPETLALTQALADRCALALDNAQLYARRDHVAVSLQEELLPRALPDVPGIDAAARYAAAGEGNEVGGDFYDLFHAGGGWHAVIGDVVGKGPMAAAVTGLARHTLRTAAAYEHTPSALLRVLNDALLAERPGERLASAGCVRLEGADGALTITVSSAGHPLPLVVEPDGHVREIGRHGLLLGVDAEPALFDVSERLHAGDVLVLFTDGVIEARGPTGFFGEERLRGVLAEAADEAPSRVVDRIHSAVLAASGGLVRDDLAIVALRVRPRSETR